MDTARGWVEKYLINKGVLYYEAGKPYLSGKGEPIIEGAAMALRAAVRAKGETDAELCDSAFLRYGCTCARVVDDHAADVPPPPEDHVDSSDLGPAVFTSGEV